MREREYWCFGIFGVCMGVLGSQYTEAYPFDLNRILTKQGVDACFSDVACV